MTKHVSVHAQRHFPRSESRNSSYKSRSRSRCIQDHHHHHLTNAVSSSNSSQGVTATYCSIDGPGPPLNCCLGSTDANLTRCYTPQHTCEIPNGRISAVYAQQHQQPPLKQFVVTDNNIQYYPDNYASLPQCFTNANYAAAVNVYNNEYHREDTTTVPFIGENALTVIESSNRSSDRPASPVSISTTDGVVAPCGGHCRTFEKFCHYFLLVLFVAGILTGICLVLAGYILHGQKRGGDLMVLVYIGALTAIVCTLLLSIQCNVRRDAKRRKRRRTFMMMSRGRIPVAGSSSVPLSDLRPMISVAYQQDPNNPGGNYQLQQHGASNNNGNDCGVAPVSTYPHHLVIDNADNPADIQMSTEMPLMRGIAPNYPIRGYNEMSQSQNGIPWWRREKTQVTYKYGNIV